MKLQTREQMIEAGATPQEADAALKLFEIMRPSLKIKRENGRIETTHGDKSILGWYRTCKDNTKV
jgi:hypothetical protein